MRVFLALCSIKCDEIHSCFRWGQGPCYSFGSFVSLVSGESLGECIAKRPDRRDTFFCLEWLFDFDDFDGPTSRRQLRSFL